MAFVLAPTSVGLDTPITVDIKDHPRPVLKKCPQIVKVDDSIGAFSRVPNKVMHIEDVFAYIDCTMEDLGSSEIKTMYMTNLLNKKGSMKPKFQILKDQGFTNILEMLEFEDEMIWYVLSHVHEEFMWLDRPYKITKETIRVIISFPQTGQTPGKNKISNNEVEKLAGATFDN